MIWVEHYQLRSAHPEQADDYENCLLSCRFCNNSRLQKPTTDQNGRCLLDPTRSAWGERFEWDGDYLKPGAGDADAEYTWYAYHLDHPKKVERRSKRAEVIGSSLEAIELIMQAIAKLDRDARAAEAQQDWGKARRMLAKIRQWERHLSVVKKQLLDFRAIPRDAPEQCRCGSSACMTLPAWLAEQITQVPPAGPRSPRAAPA